MIRLKKTKKFISGSVKVLAYPFKKLATDEELRKKLFYAALDIGVAYAEAKLDGRGDEFIIAMKKEF